MKVEMQATKVMGEAGVSVDLDLNFEITNGEMSFAAEFHTLCDGTRHHLLTASASHCPMASTDDGSRTTMAGLVPINLRASPNLTQSLCMSLIPMFDDMVSSAMATLLTSLKGAADTLPGESE